MKVMNIDIPQAAIDAGNAAMVDGFRAVDVEGAVAVALHDLYHKAPPHEHFDYGIQPKDAVHMRLADRLIQKARKAGRIKRVDGQWRRTA